MNLPRQLPRFGLLLLLAGMGGCAQIPLLGDRDRSAAQDTAEAAPQQAETLAADDDEPEVHGLAAWTAWIASAPPQRVRAVIADLQALGAPTAMQSARLGVMLARPGHADFAPRAGLAAMNRALAAGDDLARHDIQTLAASIDETQAWLAHTDRLSDRAAAAEALAADLEAKIQALAEIENGL